MLQRFARCAESTSLDSLSWGVRLDDGAESTRVHGMKSYFKLGVALCVIAFSIGASAGSIKTFNYSTVASGVSNTTVLGTFKYNTVTGTFTSESLSFVGNSIFGGLSGTVTKPQSGSTFLFNATLGGYTVSYTIVLNLLDPGSYTANGNITHGLTTARFAYGQVPEGGAQLSYLAASGLALFAGMLLAGKQRRRPLEN